MDKKKLLIGMGFLAFCGGSAVGGGMVALAALWYRPRLDGSGRVELLDPEPNGMSAMMGQLMGAFMADPKKKAVADGMNVSIAIDDIANPDASATITFKGSDVAIANGVAPDADIYIGTELGLLLSLSGAGKGAEMLEWLKTEDGRNLVKAAREGRFKVKGALLNAPQMMKLQALLSPAAA